MPEFTTLDGIISPAGLTSMSPFGNLAGYVLSLYTQRARPVSFVPSARYSLLPGTGKAQDLDTPKENNRKAKKKVCPYPACNIANVAIVKIRIEEMAASPLAFSCVPRPRCCVKACSSPLEHKIS